MSKNINKLREPVNKKVAKETPLIMQLEFLECGAACLDMILAYFGKWIPLEVVRKDCGVSRDGSNAKNILLAARKYGLKAAGYKLEIAELKEEGIFPCIIHWNFNHFVVLKGFKHDKVYINDPGRGEIIVSMKEFDESYTGVCMFFEPTEAFVPEGKPKSIIGFAKKRLKGSATSIAFVVLTTVITSLIGIIRPGFSRVFIDYLLEGRASEWTTGFFIALFGLTIIEILASLISCIYSLRISGKLSTVGSTSFMWKVLRMPMEFFTQRMAGDIKMRQDTNAFIAQELINTIAPLFLKLVMTVFYFIVMFRYSVILSIIGLSSIVVNYFVSSYVTKKRINISRIAMKQSGKLAATTVSGIEMIETIKASGAEDGFFKKWAGYQAGVNLGEIKSLKLDMYMGLIPQIFSIFTNTLITAIGIMLIISGQFTIGSFMAFQGILTSFEAPASELITARSTMLEMKTQMERIEDVMEYPDDEVLESINVDGTTDYRKLSGNIEIKDITFGYSPLAAPLIEGFSMNIKSGSKVAFVGGTGCGKSTLSKLISGLYMPWKGEILFDGKSVKEIDHAVFTGSVAVVDQDIILFEDTIANNIKMWDDSIEDFEVIMAARDANIHEDIMAREGGYDYKLSEGGKDFSGGQRQRLEIARVLAQDPTIIIMDEATSALDAATEAQVVRSITDRGITCIVIAHRLSTIRDCDEIVVLNKGHVVERGTHDELMKLQGEYSKLVINE